jgi:hypothetical protein
MASLVVDIKTNLVLLLMPPPLFVIVKQKQKDKIVPIIKTVDIYDYYPFEKEWKLVYNPKWKIFLMGNRVR